MTIKPDNKVTTTIFLAFLALGSLTCVMGITYILVRAQFTADAFFTSLVCLLLFAIPGGLLFAEYRRFKSFVLNEHGVSCLSYALGTVPPFFTSRTTVLDWIKVRKLTLKGVTLLLHADTACLGINLLWFRETDKVIEFVTRNTGRVPNQE